MVLSRATRPRVRALRRDVGRPAGQTSLAMELQAAGHEMRDAGVAIHEALLSGHYLRVEQRAARLVVRGQGYIRRGFDDAA